MIPMEAAVLVPWPLVWIALQLIGPCQCRVVPNLHQDLIEWSVKGSEVGNLSW